MTPLRKVATSEVEVMAPVLVAKRATEGRRRALLNRDAWVDRKADDSLALNSDANAGDNRMVVEEVGAAERM